MAHQMILDSRSLQQVISIRLDELQKFGVVYLTAYFFISYSMQSISNSKYLIRTCVKSIMYK